LTKETPLINFVHGSAPDVSAEYFPRGKTIMKMWKIFLTLCVFSISGCAIMYAPPRVNTSAKTNVAFLKYKKIAVITFHNPKNKPAGLEAANILALGFVKKGFNVAGNSEVASLIDQDDIYKSGLTPEIKSKLKSVGIDGIVTGTINEYFCSGPDTGLLIIKERKDNHCSVNVQTELLDLDSGEIIWGTTASNVKEGKWVTEDSVLRIIMWYMQERVPDITQLRQIGKQTAGRQYNP
jgi:hypothetical protein